MAPFCSARGNRPRDCAQLQDPPVSAPPVPTKAPLRQWQVVPWKYQHPLDIWFATICVSHVVSQAFAFAAVGVISATLPFAQLVTVLTFVQASGTTKVAVTFTSAAIERVQVPTPVQPPPDQPAKVDPPVAAAVRTTLLLPGANSAEHAVVPQLIPTGADVTFPVPFPALVTVNAYCPAVQLPPGDEPPPGVKVPFRQ